MEHGNLDHDLEARIEAMSEELGRQRGEGAYGRQLGRRAD